MRGTSLCGDGQIRPLELDALECSSQIICTHLILILYFAGMLWTAVEATGRNCHKKTDIDVQFAYGYISILLEISKSIFRWALNDK